ncbi:MAG: GNAT family N-acetyltransferase [Rhodobacterales bacterium]|nr:MAG: GNAT family N-acetyltransferase [Rhodobacterales bacterium]
MTRDLKAPVTTPLPRPRPDGRALTGRFCRLERLTLAHADALFDAFGDEPDWDYLPYGPFDSVQSFRLWLVQTCLDRDPLFYAILKEGRPLGIAALMRIEPEHGVIEVGHIHHAPALQGSPATTEAMALLMAHVFDDLGYRRYEWKCDAANARSRAAALRLGFQEEGTFRQHLVLKGRNRDTQWFSILDGEWPTLKARFDRWLTPENFDAQGRQVTRLSEV